MNNLRNLIVNGIDKILSILNFFQDIVTYGKYNRYSDRKNIIEDNIEELMNFNELAESKGYVVEDHLVTTQDGYILKLHRLKLSKEKEEEKILFNENAEKQINNKRNKKFFRKKLKNVKEILTESKFDPFEFNHNNKAHPILLMHGIFVSSEGWILNDEEKCVAFKLVNSGYDVWLGNNRGNKYSRDHKYLTEENCDTLSETNINYSFFRSNKKFDKNFDPQKNKKLKNEFWDFSFHEMGKFDLPAFIDYILQINEAAKKLIYIGHSQGTIQLFSGLAENFDYFKEKINLFVALAPVAKTKHLDSPLYDFLDFTKMDFISQSLGFTELFPSTEKCQKVFSWLFKKYPIIPRLMVELIGDKGSCYVNNINRIPFYLSHIPSGSSLKAICHLVQMFRSNKFCMYDFGEKENLSKYGRPQPPDFSLNHVKKFPIGLFSGKLDRLSHPNDVIWLKETLKDTLVYSKCYEDMGHLSFQISKSFLWFEDVLKLIEENKSKTD